MKKQNLLVVIQTQFLLNLAMDLEDATNTKYFKKYVSCSSMWNILKRLLSHGTMTVDASKTESSPNTRPALSVRLTTSII